MHALYGFVQKAFSPALVYIWGACGAQNIQTHQQEKTGVQYSCACWKSSAFSACCKRLSNISVRTRQAVRSRVQFPCRYSQRCHSLHESDLFSQADFTGIIDVNAISHKRMHAQPQILQISQLSWLRTLRRVQNVTFSLCICTFVTTGLKNNRKVETAGGWQVGCGMGASLREHIQTSQLYFCSSAISLFPEDTARKRQYLNTRLLTCHSMSAILQWELQVCVYMCDSFLFQHLFYLLHCFFFVYSYTVSTCAQAGFCL